VCDFAISKNQSKSKKGEDKSIQQKIGTRVEQQRSFHVLAYMLVTLATFHAETSELKTMAPRNTARTPQSPQKNITQREEKEWKKGSELVPMCDFSQYLKIKAKAKKEEDKSIQQKLERGEQQRSFYVLSNMLVTRATSHLETSPLKSPASLNTAQKERRRKKKKKKNREHPKVKMIVG
jgi:hypothetical protein